MTLARRAVSTTFFSDGIVCRFRLRPLVMNEGTSGAGVARLVAGPDESERVIDCSFSRPALRTGGDLLVQRGRCATSSSSEVSVTVHDRRGGVGRGLRMFAGLVSDPFILQFESLFKTIATGRMAFQKQAKNSLEGANVLGLVVEVERAAWLGDGPLFGVVGETLASGMPGARLERIGRPEVKNISLQGSRCVAADRDDDLGSLYNREDAFHLVRENVDAYRARLNVNFRFFDGLDGKIDWPLDAAGLHPLVDLVLNDYLVVDASRPFSDATYFEIEQAMLEARRHRTCGGRWLNDDFLDTYYTLLINAGKGPRISDGVNRATVPASKVFPYLAPPNPLQSRLRRGGNARSDQGSATG